MLTHPLLRCSVASSNGLRRLSNEQVFQPSSRWPGPRLAGSRCNGADWRSRSRCRNALHVYAVPLRTGIALRSPDSRPARHRDCHVANLHGRRLADPVRSRFARSDRRAAVSLTLSGGAAWSVRFGARRLASTPGIEITPEESGYFAIERQGSEARSPLVPVTVTPDRAPTVRIESPGRDLLMPSARGSIAVASVASDDFGVQSLELRYTKVSGSGEQFQFVEGSLPLSIARENARSCGRRAGVRSRAAGPAARGFVRVSCVARDGRPGPGGVATSDTFFIEIAGPGQVALPGSNCRRTRDALSQQMIVLKLQRLRARGASISREALAEEVSTLAAEQRADAPTSFS